MLPLARETRGQISSRRQGVMVVADTSDRRTQGYEKEMTAY
jgi:hypothetical protein